MRFGLAGIAVVTAACSLNVNPRPLGAQSDGGDDVGSGVDAGTGGASCTLATAVGKDHTCAVRSDGTVWCWGRNDAGQLGDGSLVDQPAPVQVMGLTGIAGIAGGDNHSCAIGAGGMVWCWGRGLLGDGSLPHSPSSLPVQVSNVSGAVQIVAGGAHSCARLDSGNVVCWGENTSGQLGDATTTPPAAPVAVQGPTGVTALAAGNNTTCAVAGNQALWCWGSNRSGQLGVEPTTLPGAPRDLEIPGGVVGVAVGDVFTCAMTSAGGVLCFGSNDRVQLGEDASVTSRPTPKPVVMPVKAVAIAAGAHFVCVTEDDPRHRLWCWGDNSNFQLANTTSESRPFPVLSQYTNIAEIAGGDEHLCVRSMDGGLLCSGYNGHGQIGDGLRTTYGTPRPLAIAGLTEVVSIAAGENHTCALLRDSKVWCWGANEYGQLGNGSWNDSPTPTKVESITDAVEIAIGGNHSCARLADGSVSCWGRNDVGQLGDDTFVDRRSVARKVIGVTGATQISLGRRRTCALGAGKVSCWGEHTVVAADNIDVVRRTPTETPDPAGVLAGVLEIAAGARHTCAITATSTAVCWGDNDAGELGTGNTMDSGAPSAVMQLMNVEHITASVDFGCALSNKSVLCWGLDSSGQLGNGSAPTNTTLPQAVTRLSARKIAAGSFHSCAITSPGDSVACWGSGDLGQLGDGSYSGKAEPVDVVGLSEVMDIAAGGGHTCAVVGADHHVTCWGDDRRGQLGDGGARARTGPTAPQLACP